MTHRGDGSELLRNSYLPDPFTTDDTRKQLAVSGLPLMAGHPGAWRPESHGALLPSALPRPSIPSGAMISDVRMMAAIVDAPICIAKKHYLPAVQKVLTSTHENSKFLKYLQQRHNLRFHVNPVVEVFPRTSETPRTAGKVGLRILLHLDIKSLLLAQRVSRQFDVTVRINAQLQRRLWFYDVHCDLYSDFRHIDPHDHVDPLIDFIRRELGLFYHYYPNSMIQSIMYAPTGRQVGLPNVVGASWRRMLAMRTAERGKRWRVHIHGRGILDMGVFQTSPTFGQVVDAALGIPRSDGKPRRFGIKCEPYAALPHY